MEKRNKYAMSQLIKEVGKCELCGSKRGLEVHHIIPISFGGDDVDENKIVVCCGCHAKLTPRRLLTTKGIKRAKENNVKIDALNYCIDVFYGTLNSMVENFDIPDFADVCDAFDNAIQEALKLEE